jgi:glycosyltransferase involved in cell wall biosynthesis
MAAQVSAKDDASAIVAIIALYNGEPYIAQALKSILNQTYPAADIVVVDDGSVDGGPQIVADMAMTDPRIRLIRKSNGGQSSARNLGVRQSCARYIAFLDQDDEWRPHHLETLYAPFAADPNRFIGFTYGNLDEVDVNGRMVNMMFLSKLRTAHPKTSITNCLEEDMFVLPGASLIRRDVFDAVGGFDEALIGYEDDDFFSRVFEKGYRNHFVNEAVTLWRIHRGSTSYSQKMQVSRMIYARKLIARYPDDPTFHRYYVRDLIAPRFVATIQVEYLGALKYGRRDQAALLAQHLWELSRHLSFGRGMKLRCLLALTRAKSLARAVIAAGPYVPGLRRMAMRLA